MELSTRWDASYADGDASRSWHQSEPAPSLAMLQALGVGAGVAVLDVGGGSSCLVDSLLARGFGDLTVLDVSRVGLDIAVARLGPSAASVQWVHADLERWQPGRPYGVWHDRAVLHFATTAAAQRAYLHTLTAGTEVGSLAVIGCFAPAGPDHCSGLAVTRYDAAALAALLGPAWRRERATTETHHTPAGAAQPFTWAGFRRVS